VPSRSWSPPAVSNQPRRQAGVGPRDPIPGDALLETTGRRTGLPRRTAVCDGLDGETFWLVAQRGRSPGWMRNIEADPRVRIRVSGLRTGWRAGTAHILDSDDPQERRRILTRANPAPALHVHHQGTRHKRADSAHRSRYAMIYPRCPSPRGTHPCWHVPPGRTDPDPPADAIDQPASGPFRRTTWLLRLRQQRLQHRPLRVTQVEPLRHR
jgi:deazaflavin-dependent oxidoreductase (nitroreductase family)